MKRLPTLLLLWMLLASAAAAERTLVLEGIRVDAGGGTEQAVRRLLPMVPGDPLDEQSLSQAQESLDSSGLFDSVAVYSERGSQPGSVFLVVDAELDRGLHLETGFGNQFIDGWYLDLLGARWNSPFGRGGHLRFGFRSGQRSSGLQGRLEVPSLVGPADLLVELSNMQERWRIYEELSVFEQEIQKSEFLLGLRFGEQRSSKLSVWIGGSSADPSKTVSGVKLAQDEAAGRLIPLIDERQKFGTLGVDLEMDHRHVAQPWRDGWSAGLRVRSYSVKDGDNSARADFEQSLALPMPAASALAFQGRLSMSSPETPYYLRPIFGGVDTVRGYRDASLSGAMGARAYWKLSSEWRMPLMAKHRDDPRVLGVLFADVGRHWDTEGQRQDASVGVGYGLRVRVPWLHIFSVDVGIPLSEETTGDNFWAHVRLGYGF